MNAVRPVASSSTSRRAPRGSGSNGSARTRDPSTRHVPATCPSTRNVPGDCGVFVMAMSAYFVYSGLGVLTR